jgi:hypothetical protein
MHKICVSIWVATSIVHDRNPKLHVCFGKVKNGPTYTIVRK